MTDEILQTLNSHTKTLQLHTEKLDSHTKTLKSHGEQLELIASTVLGHSEKLKKLDVIDEKVDKLPTAKKLDETLIKVDALLKKAINVEQ